MQEQRAGFKYAVTHADFASLGIGFEGAAVDRFLQRGGIQRLAIAHRAKVFHVHHVRRFGCT